MDSKNNVLILGNGISRLQYLQEIEDVIGDYEIWGSNHIFLEYGYVLTRVNGHAESVEQAQVWKELHKYTYRVITEADYTMLPDVLRGNSGIFLISQALQDEYKQIHLCGFDFGGKDVWTPRMQTRNVTAGLQRKWVRMLGYFPGARDRINFWPIRPGYDKLSTEYTPVFNNAEKEVIQLRTKLRALSGQEVITPPVPDVNEETRDLWFYEMMMQMGQREGE